MSTSIHSKSTFLSLLFTGRISNFLTPWHVIVDFDNETITVKKRNWYLINFDTQTFAFKYIRNIEVDTHLFGADIKIKVMGGTAVAYSIAKRDARAIRDNLIAYNGTKKSKHMVMH